MHSTFLTYNCSSDIKETSIPKGQKKKYYIPSEVEFDEPLFNLTKLAIGQHTLPQLTFQYKGKSNKRFIC